MTSFRPPRALVLLFLSQALATGATTASTTLASLVMADLGHEALSGLPSTLVTLSAALSAGLFGNLMLRRGRRFGLVGAYLLGVLGAALGFVGAWQRVVPLFLLGAALIGAAQGGYQLSRYAVAESVPDRVRGAVLGAVMLASVIGSAGTTALSNVLMTFAMRLQTSSEVMGWLLAGGFLLLGAFLTSFWRPLATPLPVNAPSQQRAAAQTAPRRRSPIPPCAGPPWPSPPRRA
ncbi:MFS transporter [Deinococcus sp. KNUC1210]|uniref:MFS transporter n=1 Tax=Deinococcus sp. KNUC1210 TaxID=2917691 RepID=UPI001EF070D0|nr:MFS transporter [Deinococcus sp. KNUC1210]ULH16152.1 MFS transporter [Deinococcus sp. KNUC1210]